MPINAITQDDFEPRTMDEAARHFAKKAALTDDVFQRLSAAAKQRAFRVATLHKAHLVQRARDIVHRAIRDGTPYGEVRRQLLTIFDTEGIPRPALHRLRTVFQQNVQQAYNDARREVLDEPEISEAFPFRQYLTVGNGTPGVRNVRPEHAALHGLVFAWNDPFWDAHTPPWDWGCRCTIVALTENQVRRMRVKVRNLGYIRRRIRVPGRGGRGIGAKAAFARDTTNLAGVDRELREALEEMLKG